jgi:hypothetical protein
VGDIKLLKQTGTVLDDVVTEILKSSPRWEPAVQYNRKVIAFRKQKLDYTVAAP